MVAELGFNWSRDLAFLEFESDFFEFFDHFASGEGSEVASFFARRAEGDLFGDFAEFFSFV